MDEADRILNMDFEEEVGTFNPLSPHYAIKHHLTFLKTDLIFLQPRVLE